MMMMSVLMMAPTTLSNSTFAQVDLAIVTGAGLGIGRSVATLFGERDVHVLAVGRTLSSLVETSRANPLVIEPLVADVGMVDGREVVVRAVERITRGRAVDGGARIVLVHSAGIPGQLATIHELELSQFHDVMRTNVEGPLFLTQRLLPLLGHGSRILHVSSGAAHQGLAGIAPYSASKAALYSIYQSLRSELSLAKAGILVGSVVPGAVDTRMQARLRNTSSAWPLHEYFTALARSVTTCAMHPNESSLSHPRLVGRFMRWLLLETSDVEYTSHEWDILDPTHLKRWCCACD